ncbi:MAG: glycosyltransferase, partial [Acidimicrobiales bacterium]
SVVSEADHGQAHAIDKGFQRTSGEIMGWINSDDLLLPGSLRYVGKYFLDHPEIDVLYGHRVLIDEQDREVGRWVLPAHDSEVLSWADYVPQETMFWRRNIWEEAGGQIDQSFQFAVDWDLILRFREAGARFARVPRFLGAFRIHSNQKTSAQMADIGEREMWRLRDRCHGRRVEYPEVNSEIRGYLRRHVVVHNLYRFGLLRY